MRYFTLAQAQDLLPEVEKIMRGALDLRERAEAKAARLRDLEASASETAAADAAIERAQLQFLVNAINARLQEITALGAVPKGLDPALVDFPHRLKDREVYLCWSLGEKTITHYHGIEDGFPGRKELPARYAS